MINENVGDELTALIPKWAVQFEGECGCKDVAKKMNKWGIKGCINNKKYLVNHLMSQDEKLIPMFRAIPEVVKRKIAERLISRAITNTQKRLEAER